MSDLDQWSTARPFLSAAMTPQWAGPYDKDRIAAYAFYEQVYWNVPDAFKLIQRGSDTKPIYIPTAMTLIETMHRYLAPGIRIVPDPELGSSSEQAAAALVWKAFSRRERMGSKFQSNKRFGLIRGDWAWHLTADAERAEGSRISLHPLDPGSIFKITMPDDVDTVIGYHVVDTIMEGSDAAIYRLTYRKETEMGGPSPIIVSEDVFEIDKWGGPDMEETRIRSIRAEERLPDPIDDLPIYHMRNFSEPGSEWGSSELRGFERIISAINQSISDEELELVLNGLGVYVTDAGAPIDSDGQPTTWNLGPAKVVELPPGKTFKRESGTSSVAPHQDHLKYLHEQLDLGSGTPAIAKGRIADVQVAESGIALALELAPIFARAEEKEQEITDVMSNLTFNFRKFCDAYEGGEFTFSENVVLIPQYGDRIPTNRKQRFEEVLKLVDSKVVSAAWGRRELTKIGFVFEDDTTLLGEIIQEQAALAQIEADVTGSRMDSELGAGDDEEDEDL